MNSVLPSKVYELIKQVVNDDITKFSISVQDPNKKGEGYLGEICFVALQDSGSEKLYNFVIKQAFADKSTRKANPIRYVFTNEIHFYTKVWPSFQRFQEKIPSTKAFNKVVKCFGATDEDGYEKIVLDNIRFHNFDTLDKTKTFDGEHVEYILKEYGKYHALSFAYKATHPKEFSELARELNDVYLDFLKRKYFQDGVDMTHENCLKNFQPGKDDDIIEKYKYYIKNGVRICRDSLNYTGSYSVILHGDCWSNNMMFKYDKSGKLCDMRFLDFQMSKAGSPIHDLSYFLYSGASKEIFDQLDYYLKVYHNSLGETLKEFGLNSEDIYPFRELKSDWKRGCQLGFTMALMLWKGKLLIGEATFQITDIKDDTEDLRELLNAAEYDETTFRKITKDLILHMYENDFLINY